MVAQIEELGYGFDGCRGVGVSLPEAQKFFAFTG